MSLRPASRTKVYPEVIKTILHEKGGKPNYQAKTWFSYRTRSALYSYISRKKEYQSTSVDW